MALLKVFEDLKARGIAAEASAGYTQSDGWDTIEGWAEEQELDDDPSAVFWTSQKHESFDDVGNLRKPLFLHWRGDLQAICTPLRDAGFEATEPSDEDECIEVRRAGESTTSFASIEQLPG